MSIFKSTLMFSLLLVVQLGMSETILAANTSMCASGPNVCLVDSRYRVGNRCECYDKNKIQMGTVLAVGVSSLCKVTGRDQQCLTGTISRIGTECICDQWVGVVIPN